MWNDRMYVGVGIAICLLASALAVAPVFMPEGYSWVTHTSCRSSFRPFTNAGWRLRDGLP